MYKFDSKGTKEYELPPDLMIAKLAKKVHVSTRRVVCKAALATVSIARTLWIAEVVVDAVASAAVQYKTMDST